VGVLDTLWRHFRPDPNRRARTVEGSGALLAGMAGELRFADEGEGTLPELTPLLSAGEGRHQRFTRILRGPLGVAGTTGPCALASFVYQFRISKYYGWARSNTGEIPCVLVAVELEMPGESFEGVYVQPKQPPFGYSGTRYPLSAIRELKTSDTALHERYDVFVHDLQDETAARGLLEDGLSDLLARYPVEPGFEVSGPGPSSVWAGARGVSGTWLCTFVERSLTTEADVLNLLDAARGLVPRVIAAGESFAVERGPHHRSATPSSSARVKGTPSNRVTRFMGIPRDLWFPRRRTSTRDCPRCGNEHGGGEYCQNCGLHRPASGRAITKQRIRRVALWVAVVVGAVLFSLLNKIN
jgi:hypothetical protein